MAYSGTVSTSYHGTAGTAVDTVTLSRKSSSVRIVNRGASDIYYTLGLEGATAVTPVVGADNTYICIAGEGQVENAENLISSVKLIAAAASVYSVEAHH